MSAKVDVNVTIAGYQITEQLYSGSRTLVYRAVREGEIKAILQSVLAPELSPKINLAAAIEKRFANLGDFELTEITRE